jgi:y4mF family transcriptional regulator
MPVAGRISTKGRIRESPDLDTIGRAVRAARRRHGMTQVELAGLSGTSQRFVSQLESGVRNVTLSKVFDVLAVLGLRLQVTGGEP